MYQNRDVMSSVNFLNYFSEKKKFGGTTNTRCGSPVLTINSRHYNTAKQTAYHPLNTDLIIHEAQYNKWGHASLLSCTELPKTNELCTIHF